MKNWFMDQNWEQVYKAESAHDKAAIFQQLLLQALEEFFPQKIRKVNSDDQPWISHKLKVLDRKRKRIYRKERRSEKWKALNKLFKQEVKTAKAQFYKDTIADLKQKNPGQWYSCLKRITSHDQKGQQVNIDSISHLSDQEQAEIIADKFSSIPNEYEELRNDDISLPEFPPEDIPQFEPARVWLLLSQLKTNKATPPGDFPVKLSKMFAAYLAELLCDVINTKHEIYKCEVSPLFPSSTPQKIPQKLETLVGYLPLTRLWRLYCLN